MLAQPAARQEDDPVAGGVAEHPEERRLAVRARAVVSPTGLP
jgi:hypothetical protein